MRLPQPTHNVIPHRDSMLLIDTLLSSEQGHGTASVTLSPDSIVVDNSGAVSPLAYIELMAQTYAAVKGWEMTMAGQEFPIGYLVGVQKFEARATGRAGETLTIDVETVGEFEGFAVVEGCVSREDTVLGQGKIKLWVPLEEDK